MSLCLESTGGGGREGGGAKSQYPYVGRNSPVTECPIKILLSGMTYYHHWFKEFDKSKHISVHFFQNEGSSSHLFDSLDSRIQPNFIELCFAIQITFLLKNHVIR